MTTLQEIDLLEILQTTMETLGSGHWHFVSVCTSERRILPPIKISLRSLLLKTVMKIDFNVTCI